MIGFRNGVLDTQNGTFAPPRSVTLDAHPVRCEYAGGRWSAETHAPAFWRWLDRAAGGRAEKRDVILAALVLANHWQLFLEVTGPGGSGETLHGRNSHPAGRGG